MSKPFTSILQTANEQAEALAKQALEDKSKGDVGVDITPDGVEANASVDVGDHAAVGGFVSRSWAGALKWGAKFKARW